MASYILGFISTREKKVCWFYGEVTQWGESYVSSTWGFEGKGLYL